MESLRIARDDAADGTVGEHGWRPRRPGRFPVSKPARIAFGGSVFDCALLNASPFGAHVRLQAFAEVPSLATLMLPGGECRPVRRRWQDGLRVGFEAVGTEPLMVLAA